MKRVTYLLKSSINPVILAGHGIRQAKAEKTFIELIEKLNIPVMTTWRAADLIDDDHRLFIGRPGLVSYATTMLVSDTCDLIICIGTRLDLPQVCWDYSRFAPKATKVVVDIDRAELNKLPKNWIKIQSDAGVFINELYQSL